MSEETKTPTPPPSEDKVPDNPSPAPPNDGVVERRLNPSSSPENYNIVAMTAPKNDRVLFLSRGGRSLKK